MFNINKLHLIISPKNVLSITTFMILVLATTTILVALSMPQITPDVRRYQDKQIQVLNTQGKWEDVLYFASQNQKIIASKNLALEEPDQIILYADINQLMQENTLLNQALREDKLTAVTKTQTVRLKHRKRELRDLPIRFWIGLAFSLVSILIAGAVFAFGGWQPAVSAYVQNATIYFVFTTAANLYGTRQLIIEGDLFNLLHTINHMGTLFGMAAVMVLLWVSPKPIHEKSIKWWIYGLAGILVLVDIYQVFTHQVYYFYSVLLMGMVAALALGLYQWWQVKHIAVEKAAMRWILLSVMLPLSLFSLMYLFPVVFSAAGNIPQGYMYGIILFINIGLGFGVLRYKIFELERWWFSIWTWFIGGLSIILVDALLLTVLPISKENGLLLSVALVGWLYFPIRQWALGRIQRQNDMTTDSWLPKILPLLLNSQADTNQNDIQRQWVNILAKVFTPLDITAASKPVSEPKIFHSGQALLVPPLSDSNENGYVLHYATKGQRLFTKDDYDVLTNLKSLTELAVAIANARIYGARLERERLARDIHDDISAKLLSILQQSNDKQKVIVQETLVELRNLLNQLDTHEIDFADALAEWRLETSLRLQPYTIMFDWQVSVINKNDIILSSNEYSNIRRILREAVTNALKYMNNHKLKIYIYDHSYEYIGFRITNYGSYLPVNHNSGRRGIKNIAARVKNMEGEVAWQKRSDSFELHFTAKIDQSTVSEVSSAHLPTLADI